MALSRAQNEHDRCAHFGPAFLDGVKPFPGLLEREVRLGLVCGHAVHPNESSICGITSWPYFPPPALDPALDPRVK